MLLYLSDVGEIINTDFIVQVISTSRRVEHIEDEYSNLSPDESIYKKGDIQDIECCCIIMKNGRDIELEMSIKEFWEFIQNKI